MNNVCAWCGYTAYPVIAYSTDGNGHSVTNSTAEPAQSPYAAGSTVTFTAEAAPGYTFLGWYRVTSTEDNEVTDYDYSAVLCSTLIYHHLVTGAVEVAAVFAARDNVDVTVETVNGAEYYFGDEVEKQTGEVTRSLPLGTELTLRAADADKVLQWKNESDKVLGTGPSLSLTVTGSMRVTLVYQNGEAGDSVVQFLSDFDQVMLYSTYQSVPETVSFPLTPPSKFGFSFLKWVFENTDVEATNSTVREKIADNDRLITLRPDYSRLDENYTVTVRYEGVAKDGRTFADIPVGTGYTVTAPPITGYNFQHWKDADGVILSYRTGYFFQVSDNVTLTAVYSTEEPDPQPVITLGQPFATSVTDDDVTVHKVSCAATRSVPAGYTLLEQGMLYGKDLGEDFKPGDPGVCRVQSRDLSLSGVFTMNVKVASDSLDVFFRGYMILRDDSTGNETTMYTAVQHGTYADLASQA